MNETVGKAVGQLMSGTLGLGGGIASFYNKKNLEKEQMKRAQKLLDTANVVVAPEIQKEFLDNKSIAEQKAITGLAGKERIQNRLDANTANMLSGARLSTTDSGALLAAITAAQSDANQKMTDLGIQDAQAKNEALSGVQNATTMIAGEKNRLDAIKREQQSNLRKQASALENAATTNKYQGYDELIGTSVKSGANIGAGVIGLASKGAINVDGSEVAKNAMPTTKLNNSVESQMDASALGADGFDSLTEEQKLMLQKKYNQKSNKSKK